MVTESRICDIFQEIEDSIYDKDVIFNSFWDLCNLNITEKIPTAGVMATDDGRINLYLNDSFWKSLNEKEKGFVICHECLHVFYMHCSRMIEDKYDSSVVNIAMDVIVNGVLMDIYDYKHEDLPELNTMGGIYTRDSFDPPIPTEYQSAEDIYDYLIENHPEESRNTFDDVFSSAFGSTTSPSQNKYNNKQVIDKILDDIIDYGATKDTIEILDSDDSGDNRRESFMDMCGIIAGKAEAAYWETIVPDEVKNAPWTKLIRKWAITETRRQGIDDDLSETWAYRERKLAVLDKEILLPSDVDIDEFQKGNVAIFLDTSGSCSGYSRKFVSELFAMPHKYMKSRAWGFTTNTYEIDLNNRKNVKIHSGGTEFGPLERTILKNYKNKYPDIIIVLTDGEGSYILPTFPDRWHWFLFGSMKKYHIPEGSHVYDLNTYKKF